MREAAAAGNMSEELSSDPDTDSEANEADGCLSGTLKDYCDDPTVLEDSNAARVTLQECANQLEDASSDQLQRVYNVFTLKKLRKLCKKTRGGGKTAQLMVEFLEERVEILGHDVKAARSRDDNLVTLANALFPGKWLTTKDFKKKENFEKYMEEKAKEQRLEARGSTIKNANQLLS